MAYANRIRIVVLHSDPVAQGGLAIAFSRFADIDVQDTPEWVETGDLPAHWHAQLGADVVVADYHSGVALSVALARVGRAGPSPRVLIVTAMDREREIRSALEQGVHGYLLVGSSLDELAAGVRSVGRGRPYLSAEVAARLAENLALEPLTAREEEVLELVVQGLCNKAIGRRLGIAVGTVKSHLKSAFGKLNVESRTQAIATVERRGLLGGDRQPTVAGVASGARSVPVRPAPEPTSARRAEGRTAAVSIA